MHTARRLVLGAIPDRTSPVMCPTLGELELLSPTAGIFGRSSAELAGAAGLGSQNMANVESASIRVPDGWPESLGRLIARSAGAMDTATIDTATMNTATMETVTIERGGPSSPLAIEGPDGAGRTTAHDLLPSWVRQIVGQRGSWLVDGMTQVNTDLLEPGESTQHTSTRDAAPLVLRVGDNVDVLGDLLGNVSVTTVRITLADLGANLPVDGSVERIDKLLGLLSDAGVSQLQVEIPLRAPSPTTLDQLLRRAARSQMLVASYLTDYGDVTELPVAGLNRIFELDPRCKIALPAPLAVSLLRQLTNKPRPWAALPRLDRRMTSELLAPFGLGPLAGQLPEGQVHALVIHDDAAPHSQSLVENLAEPTTVLARCDREHYRLEGTASGLTVKSAPVLIRRTERTSPRTAPCSVRDPRTALTAPGRGPTHGTVLHLRSDGVASRADGPALSHAVVSQQSPAATLATLERLDNPHDRRIQQ